MELMSANWGEAFLIAGKGFGTVFLILIILATVTWLVGLVFQRIKTNKEKAESATEVKQTEPKD
jgi:Na+-transporting methylmalonyl-CoA/oxaloacetate decarboxylase gamma subunit